MKRIPFTRSTIITDAEANAINSALEEGAQALQHFLIEQAQFLAIIEQQTEGMNVLMAVQNRIADCITGAVAEGLSAEDLANNLTVILGEYTA